MEIKAIMTCLILILAFSIMHDEKNDLSTRARICRFGIRISFIVAILSAIVAVWRY